MILAVDSNILFDLFLDDPAHVAGSEQALRRARERGDQLVACDVVWAEVGGLFVSDEEARSVLRQTGIGYDALTMESALRAASAWRAYRASGGRRDRVVADFLIGAHAATQADALVTRDRGAYRRYLPGLRVLDPSAV